MQPRLILLAAMFALAGFAGKTFAQERARSSRFPCRRSPIPRIPRRRQNNCSDGKWCRRPWPLARSDFIPTAVLRAARRCPVNGSAWQVMRLSRNRNWGHPALLAFLERFARKVPTVSHWPGILVGDMSQPRGGPMLTGHASHQIGLDADIWLTPMPNRELSRLEREEMSAANMVRPDRLDIDPAKWTPDHLAVIKAAAQDPAVQRIFVNAAIKKALCREASGDRSWLTKVRPYYGHDYHFHVRLACPAGEDACRDQDPVPPGDGCDASLAWWFSDAILHPRPGPEKPKPPLTMAQLPPECKAVLTAR